MSGKKEFITKDSGKRQSFSTGMVRDVQDGKPLFDSFSILYTTKRKQISFTMLFTDNGIPPPLPSWRERLIIVGTQTKDGAMDFINGGFKIGCNYWASHAGVAMWSDWRPSYRDW